MSSHQFVLKIDSSGPSIAQTGPQHTGMRSSSLMSPCFVAAAMIYVREWGTTLVRDMLSVDGNLMARKYIDAVLETTYLPFRIVHPEIRILQYDNAHPHTACNGSLLPTCSKTMLMYCHGQPTPPIYSPSSTFGISWKEVSPDVPELSGAGCSTARGMAEYPP